MTIIIPMAGKGERFFKKGYTTPKPLIPVGDVPMVVKAVQDLPEANRHIFIALDSHLKNYDIEELVHSYLPAASFVSLKEVTEGQACTVLLGLSEVDDKEEILIGACDNGMVIDRTKFNEVKQKADVVIFTFRHNVTVVNKPQQYGWVKVFEEQQVKGVSVKVPISDKPFEDHAVVGAFWFRESRIFKEATERMIKQNRRVNNEFYVDECMNDAVALGYRVCNFEIDKYICWGTPDDYLTYNYWKSFFR